MLPSFAATEVPAGVQRQVIGLAAGFCVYFAGCKHTAIERRPVMERLDLARLRNTGGSRTEPEIGLPAMEFQVR